MKRDTRPGKSVASADRAVAAALRRDRPLREFLLAFSKSVSEAGGAVFLAGGYLREVAEGAPGGDVDLMVAGLSHGELGKTLSSLPHARLGIRKVVPAGRHFPVYRVATAWRGYIDVSVARGAGSARKWDPLALALEDASRRDFTINSMLYALSPRGNRLAGDLLDPFDGVADLSRRTIRCVGDPEDRLREDPLRALRAIRMKSERKGYRIDAETFRAVMRLGPRLLPAVPGDRLAGELVRSLAADPVGTLEELRRCGILRVLLPELSRRRGGVARAARRYRSMSRSSGSPLPSEILLANLLVDLPPHGVEAAARRLRLPDVRRILLTLSDLRMLLRPGTLRYPMAGTEATLSRQEAIDPFLALYRAAMAADGRRGKDLKRYLRHCSGLPFLLDGSDLVGMGFPEGPGRQEALLAVREATLAGRIRTREEALKLAARLQTLGERGLRQEG